MYEHIPLDPSQWDQTDYPLDTLRGYVGVGGGGVEYVGVGGGGVSWGGGSLGPRPGNTAQKPLKSCLKNRSKITARNERFLSGFLSKIWAVWAVFPKKPPKPPKPLKSC